MPGSGGGVLLAGVGRVATGARAGDGIETGAVGMVVLTTGSPALGVLRYISRTWRRTSSSSFSCWRRASQSTCARVLILGIGEECGSLAIDRRSSDRSFGAAGLDDFVPGGTAAFGAADEGSLVSDGRFGKSAAAIVWPSQMVPNWRRLNGNAKTCTAVQITQKTTAMPRERPDATMVTRIRSCQPRMPIPMVRTSTAGWRCPDRAQAGPRRCWPGRCGSRPWSSARRASTSHPVLSGAEESCDPAPSHRPA